MRTHHLDINIDGSEGYHLGYLGSRFMPRPGPTPLSTWFFLKKSFPRLGKGVFTRRQALSMQAPHHRTGHERGRIAIGALRIADMSVGILRTLVKSYMNTTRTLSCLV